MKYQYLTIKGNLNLLEVKEYGSAAELYQLLGIEKVKTNHSFYKTLSLFCEFKVSYNKRNQSVTVTSIYDTETIESNITEYLKVANGIKKYEFSDIPYDAVHRQGIYVITHENEFYIGKSDINLRERESQYAHNLKYGKTHNRGDLLMKKGGRMNWLAVYDKGSNATHTYGNSDKTNIEYLEMILIHLSKELSGDACVNKDDRFSKTYENMVDSGNIIRHVWNNQGVFNVELINKLLGNMFFDNWTFRTSLDQLDNKVKLPMKVLIG